MSEPVELSVSLFESLQTLAGAAAQLQHAVDASTQTHSDDSVVSVLFRAMRVAHAACEAALTRVEPMYDADMRETTELVGCKEMVRAALENANTIVLALEYASVQYADWLSSQISVASLCGDDAMCAALDSNNVSAVALGITLSTELGISPSRNLVHYLIAKHDKPNVRVLRVLLSSPPVVSSGACYDEDNLTALMHASIKWTHGSN